MIMLPLSAAASILIAAARSHPDWRATARSGKLYFGECPVCSRRFINAFDPNMLPDCAGW